MKNLYIFMSLLLMAGFLRAEQFSVISTDANGLYTRTVDITYEASETSGFLKTKAYCVTSNDFSVTGTTWTIIGPAMTFSNSATGDFHISLTTSGFVTSGDQLDLTFFVDGTNISTNAAGILSLTSTNVTGIGIKGSTNSLISINHTVDVRAKVDAGTGTVYGATNSMPFVVSMGIR